MSCWQLLVFRGSFHIKTVFSAGRVSFPTSSWTYTICH